VGTKLRDTSLSFFVETKLRGTSLSFFVETKLGDTTRDVVAIGICRDMRVKEGKIKTRSKN